MKTLNIQLPDHLFDAWSRYAEEAGLPLESLMIEATRFSITTDRLGVEDAKLQELQRATRDAELRSRLNKASIPSTKETKKETIPTPSAQSPVDDLPVSTLDTNSLNSINMADLEEAVSREH